MPKYVAEPRYPLLAVVLVLVRVLGGLLVVAGIVTLIEAVGSYSQSVVLRSGNPELLLMTAVGLLVTAGTLFLFAGVATVLVDSEKHLRVLASIANAHEMEADVHESTREVEREWRDAAPAGRAAREEGARARERHDADSDGSGRRVR